MVGVPRKNYNSWLLSVSGILVIITLTCCQAPSNVNRLDKVVVLLNGSNTGLPEEHKNERVAHAGNISLSTRLEKTSFMCNENSEGCAPAPHHHHKVEWRRRSRSRKETEVALHTPSQIIPSSSFTTINIDSSEINSSGRGSVTNHRNFSDNINDSNNNEYLPVQYGPVSEGRGFTTGILFLIFSIIQFKIVFGAMILFLAVSPLILFIMFGPMILFLVFGPMLLMMMF